MRSQNCKHKIHILPNGGSLYNRVSSFYILIPLDKFKQDGHKTSSLLYELLLISIDLFLFAFLLNHDSRHQYSSTTFQNFTQDLISIQSSMHINTIIMNIQCGAKTLHSYRGTVNQPMFTCLSVTCLYHLMKASKNMTDAVHNMGPWKGSTQPGA